MPELGKYHHLFVGHYTSLSETQLVTDETVQLAFSDPEIRLAEGLQLIGPWVSRVLADGSPVYSASPVTVTLSASEPDKVGIPPTVVIPANEYAVEFSLLGLDLTSSTVTIEAQAAGHTASQGLIVTVEPPTLNVYVNTEQFVGGLRNEFSLTFEDNHNGNPLVSTIDRPATITLEDRDPAGIVNGLFASESGSDPIGPLTLRSGDNFVSNADGELAQIFVASPTAPGSYRVKVSIPGLGEWTSDLVVVTGAAFQPITFSHFDHVIGRGLRAQAVHIRRGVISDRVADRGSNDFASPLTIELVSAAPGIVSVPAQVTIPAGEESTVVPLSGIALSDSPIAISANVLDDPSANAELIAYVAEPQIQVFGLRSPRGVGGERDDFGVRWVVDCTKSGPCSEELYQVGQTDATVSLSIIEGSPNIIEAIYADPSGAQTRDTLVIRAGFNESTDISGEPDQVFAGSPINTGTYRILVDPDEPAISSSVFIASATSPAFSFSRSHHEVGLGLQASSVRLRRTASQYHEVEAPHQDIVISLSCIVSAVCGVPATIIMPAGQSEVSLPIAGLGLGTTRLIAAAPGYVAGAEPDVDVRVIRPRLNLVGVPELLRVGQSASLTVQMVVANWVEPLQLAISPISVTLTSSLPSAASVSSSLLIATGAHSSAVGTLLALGQGQTQLTASSVNGEPINSEFIWIVE